MTQLLSRLFKIELFVSWVQGRPDVAHGQVGGVGSVCGMDRGFVHTAQGMFCHESLPEHTTERGTARTLLQGPGAVPMLPARRSLPAGHAELRRLEPSGAGWLPLTPRLISARGRAAAVHSVGSRWARRGHILSSFFSTKGAERENNAELHSGSGETAASLCSISDTPTPTETPPPPRHRDAAHRGSSGPAHPGKAAQQTPVTH